MNLGQIQKMVDANSEYKTNFMANTCFKIHDKFEKQHKKDVDHALKANYVLKLRMEIIIGFQREDGLKTVL